MLRIQVMRCKEEEGPYGISQLLGGFFSLAVELVAHAAADRMARWDNVRHHDSFFWAAAWFRFYTPGDVSRSHLSVLEPLGRAVFSMQRVRNAVRRTSCIITITFCISDSRYACKTSPLRQGATLGYKSRQRVSLTISQPVAAADYQP